MKISIFQGGSDSESYMEWEKKIELIFDCHNYFNEKKVKLVVIGFSNYSITWWDQMITSKRRNGERPIETGEELRAFMIKRFVPSHYLYRRLQNLSQGYKSVEGYYKEMEMLLTMLNWKRSAR